MDDEIRRRSACDRCHSQKLRCPKKEGADVCDRCAKAGASCRYSPFRQKKTPETPRAVSDCPIRSRNDSGGFESKKTSANVHKRKRIAHLSPEAVQNIEPDFELCAIPDLPVEDHGASTVGLDWCLDPPVGFDDLGSDSPFGDMDFENPYEYPALELNLPAIPDIRGHREKRNSLLQFRSPPPPVTHSLDRNQYGRPWSPLPNPISPQVQFAVSLPAPKLQICDGGVRRHQPSVRQCIDQLSKLSFRLYEHSTTIPPQSVHDPVPENESYNDVMGARAKDYASYRVDDTFQLTQDLVDVYPTFIELFILRNTSHLSRNSTTSSSESPSCQSEQRLGPAAPSLSNPLALDYSSILLILSCHLRLVEIFDELLKHMEYCISQNGAVCMSGDGTFSTPQLSIGGYFPPATTAVPMQLLLLLHLATCLRDYSADLETYIRDPHEQGLASSSGGKYGDAMAYMSIASAETVKDRAAGMLKILNTMRSALLTQGRTA